MKCEDMGHEWCSNKSDSKYLLGGVGEEGGIMGDLIIRMQQNVGTYWILSIGEFHSSISFAQWSTLTHSCPSTLLAFLQNSRSTMFFLASLHFLKDPCVIDYFLLFFFFNSRSWKDKTTKRQLARQITWQDPMCLTVVTLHLATFGPQQSIYQPMTTSYSKGDVQNILCF